MSDQHRAEALAEHVRKVVDAFPPLTAGQRDRLAVLLRSPGTLSRDYVTPRPFVLDQLTALADDAPTDAELRDRLLVLVARAEHQAEQIRREVDCAPPLSAEQIETLKGLLPALTRDQREAARDDALLLLAQVAAVIRGVRR